jgi:hypothetical protein
MKQLRIVQVAPWVLFGRIFEPEKWQPLFLKMLYQR